MNKKELWFILGLVVFLMVLSALSASFFKAGDFFIGGACAMIGILTFGFLYVCLNSVVRKTKYLESRH